MKTIFFHIDIDDCIVNTKRNAETTKGSIFHKWFVEFVDSAAIRQLDRRYIFRSFGGKCVDVQKEWKSIFPWEEPIKYRGFVARSLECDTYTMFGLKGQVHTLTGSRNFTEFCREHGNCAMQDHFEFWKSNGKKRWAGKPMWNNGTSVFLDDNIGKIICVLPEHCEKFLIPIDPSSANAGKIAQKVLEVVGGF